MKQKQTSTNTNLSDSNADMKSKADITLELAKKQEADREANPNLTAVIVHLDDKTMAEKWERADKIDDSIGL